MNIHLFRPKYKIQFQGKKTTRWDGKKPLILGHPVRYVLELRNECIRVRDFTRPNSEVSSLLSLTLETALRKRQVQLSTIYTNDILSIEELNEIQAVDPSRIALREGVATLPAFKLAMEELLFQTQLKRTGVAIAALFVVVMGSKLLEPKVNTNEELIPAKYAKLILTKPKESLKTPAQGGSTQSQANVKAVARAFQSKTVQNSIKNILKGGISKYSIMATGRSITSLTQKIASNTNVMGTGIQAKASDILAGANVGKFQMGGDSGYGSGNGINVKGQGNGQVSIGLNTQDATVDEGLTKEEVARVIHSHMNEIRFCYEAAILKDPTLAGKLLVDFKINASGTVPNAGVSEASLQGEQVTQCLLGKLKSWKFPQPRGGVVVAVSYPFIFKSMSR